MPSWVFADGYPARFLWRRQRFGACAVTDPTLARLANLSGRDIPRTPYHYPPRYIFFKARKEKSMRQRTAAHTGALLAVALGTTLALSPTLALADAVAEKPAQAHEQQVSVLDLGAANTADPETPEGAANPQVPEPPVAPANPSSGQDPQPIDPSPVNPDPDPPIPQTPSPWLPPGDRAGSLPATAPGTISPSPVPWSLAGGRSPSTSTSSPPAAECTSRR